MGSSGGPFTGLWQPIDHGLKAWTFDPAFAIGGSAVTGGTLNFLRLRIAATTPITNLVLNVSTAGSGLTAGGCYAVLYTSAGTKVDITADQATAWASTGNKTMALAGGVYTAAPGDYDLAWWATGTTPPQFARCGALAAVAVGLSAATLRFGIADTGLTNAAAVPTTMGTRTADIKSWWGAVS